MTDIVGNQTLRSLWDSLSQERGDHCFLVFQNRNGVVKEYSYAEFNEEINRSANFFIEQGIEKGETVAVHMHTCPEFMMCLFGLAKIGAVMVPMNEQYLQAECEYVLEKCKITHVVIEQEFCDLYQSITASGFCELRIVVARSSEELNDFVDFETMKNKQSVILREVREIASDDIAEILFTSGTTSCPKGVILTHANMIYSGLYGNWQVGFTPVDRVLTTMPACHSNFQLAALTPVLTAAATLIVVEKYSASKFWEQICTHKATITQAVAMMVRTLLLQPVNPQEKNHCLREVLYFLPITLEEKEAFESRFGVTIMNTYGSTESLNWVITDPLIGKRNWPSIGRVGISYEAKIVDEQGNQVQPGTIGEIMIKGVAGRTLMKGYYGDEAATKEVLSVDGWLCTDDKGYQDESGWFYFVDRKSNMIKRSGENIATIELENILTSHSSIAEAAVIGIPDPIRDEAVKAFVLFVPGEELTVEEVLIFCRERMAAFKVPSVIEIVDTFPRTCSLKIEKKLLK